MQRYLILIVAAIVVIAFMFTFTVRFTESAVVTTFGKASETSVKTEPGLQLKLPFVQKVTTYDNRTRYIETALETIQTADDRQLVVTAFLMWRVEDPLQFYKTFSGAGDRAEDHYDEAENLLRSQLRGSLSVLSGYRFDQLLSTDGVAVTDGERAGVFTPDSGGSRLGEIESLMLKQLVESGDAGDALDESYGVEAVLVGLPVVRLPRETTGDVSKRMIANRTKLAKDAISQGQAQAETIRKTAEANAQRILAFARRRAAQIKADGEREAATYIAQMSEAPQFAIFLKNMQMLRESLTQRVTLVLSTDLPGYDSLNPASMDLSNADSQMSRMMREAEQIRIAEAAREQDEDEGSIEAAALERDEQDPEGDSDE